MFNRHAAPGPPQNIPGGGYAFTGLNPNVLPATEYEVMLANGLGFESRVIAHDIVPTRLGTEFTGPIFNPLALPYNYPRQNQPIKKR